MQEEGIPPREAGWVEEDMQELDEDDENDEDEELEPDTEVSDLMEKEELWNRLHIAQAVE